MNNFNKIIKEITNVLNEAAFLNSILNASILFVILYTLLTLINLFPLILSILFSSMFLIYSWSKKIDVYTANMVEKKFPFLKDKLTTAKDTIKNENLVIYNLRVEVAKKMSKVDASKFYQIGKSYLKIISIVGSLLILMFISVNNIELFDSEKILSEIDLNLIKKDDLSDSIFKKNQQNGGDGLKFEVPQTFDINDLTNEEENTFKRDEFINYDQLRVIGSEEYIDPITEEEKEVVKNYFNKINR